jgi:hypothetical protein
MQGEPWAYDKHLVVFQRIEEDEAITEVDFKHTSFWVQLHGLPIRRMTHKAATILGSSLGKIVHISEGGESAGGGQAMRIRVNVDITKPLCRGRRAKLEQDKETWISFKYERLPNFCYWCGFLTHTDKDCPIWLRNQDTLRLEDQQFGAWLRASNERPWRKTEIKVEGILRKPTTKYPNQPSPPSPYTTRYEPHPKHPSPHTNPTHSNPPYMPSSPTPPIIILTPPYPTTTPSQLPPQTISPPSPTTTLPPPQAAKPLPTPSPIHEDHVVQMDMEENLVCTPQPPQQLRPEDHFENQLRDIDSELNYYPPTTETIMKLLEKENATTLSARGQSSPLQAPRNAFGDITNTTQLTTGNTKLQSVKKSWKKLARKPGNPTGIPLDPTHTKRSFYSLDDRFDNDQFVKKQCGVVNDSISTEAVGQPRREP